MAHTTILLELSADEAQQLYLMLCDALEDFWEENDPSDASDIEYNNSLRRIRASLASYVQLVDEDDDTRALLSLFNPPDLPSDDLDDLPL